MAVRLTHGTILEVDTPKGLAYVQFTHRPSSVPLSVYYPVFTGNGRKI
jgi:hypothetical protein